MRADGGPASDAAARAERRQRTAQASTATLHTLGWVLVGFYSTDYLPPLAVRALVPGSGPSLRLYLTGYCTLAAVCLLLGLAFGWRYRAAIQRSRFPWRWAVFPTALALLLIPAQGLNEWLTRLVEAVSLVSGLSAGRALPLTYASVRARLRREARATGSPPAAPGGGDPPRSAGPRRRRSAR